MVGGRSAGGGWRARWPLGELLSGWLGELRRGRLSGRWLCGLLLWLVVAAPAAAAVPAGLAACIVRADASRLDLHVCTIALGGASGGRHERIELEVQAAVPLERLLALGVPDAHWLRIEHQPPVGPPQPLLVLHPDSGFAERPELTPRLALPLMLAPGRHTLLLHYALHAQGRVQPRLFTRGEFQRDNLRTDVRSGAIVGVLLCLVLGIVVLHPVARQRSYLAYAGLVLGHVLILVQIGGYGFALFWPQAPRWNQLGPALAGTLVVACHALFVLVFFQLRRRYPLLWRAHLGVLGLLAAQFLLLVWPEPGAVAPGEVLAAVAVVERVVRATLVLGGLYTLLALATGWWALRDRLPGARLYLLGAASLAAFNYGLFGLGVLGHNPWPTLDFFDYPRLGLLLETSLFAAALAARVRQFQAVQAEQRQRRLADAQALVQAEDARRAAQARAEQKSLLLASASHDIAQPLASLRLVVQALAQQPGNSAATRHLERTLDHAQALLRDLIERERGEHQEQALEWVSLGGLLAELVAEHQERARRQGLRLTWVDSCEEVQASRLILGRVLRNLLGNALRYSVRGRVLLGVRRRPDGLEIQVLDTGPGLPPGQAEALQQPFRQGDNAAAEGHGLGLFIVRSLCEPCGWQLRVHSLPGRGSCFGVWLPLRQVAPR